MGEEIEEEELMVRSSDSSGGDGNTWSGGGIQKDKETRKTEKAKEWKLCKGCLYYSSRLRSNGRDPPCMGTQITVPRVPASIPPDYKTVASREGNLSYFKYTCVGYSFFLHGEDSPTKLQGKPTSLPVCAGYELLLGKKSFTSSQVPARKQQKHYKEDIYFVRSRTTSRKLARENFFGRLTRNANVVASGVARNLMRVGSHIKDNLDNMLYPDRRRPK